ncbi:MAG: hypothetical protein ACJART_002127 [Maribacter sp.]|jgi:hypothetical protein
MLVDTYKFYEKDQRTKVQLPICFNFKTRGIEKNPEIINC